MKIIEVNNQEFEESVRELPGLTFHQTAGWAKLKAYTGWSNLKLIYQNEQGKCLAGGLFLLKKLPLFKAYLAYCPRGFLIDYAQSELLEHFVKDLKVYLAQKKVFELIIDPFWELNHRDSEGQLIADGYDCHYIVDQLKELGFAHKGYNLYFENLQPRWLFKLDLRDRTYEEIFNSFRYEAKRRAKKKDQLAIKVRELNESEIPVFKALMQQTAERRGFLDRSLGYYQKMYAALHGDKTLRYMVAEMDIQQCRRNFETEVARQNAKIAKLQQHAQKNAGRIKEEEVTLHSCELILEKLAECEKRYGQKAPLSVVALLCKGKEAIMLLAGNDEEYLQHFNSSNIIVAELIRLAKEEGYDYYNFYGISGDFDPANPEYGLYSYKRQYGGQVSELLGEFTLTLNKVYKSLYSLMLKAYSLTKRH